MSKRSQDLHNRAMRLINDEIQKELDEGYDLAAKLLKEGHTPETNRQVDENNAHVKALEHERLKRHEEGKW